MVLHLVAVTELAVDLAAPISPGDFRTLNRSLDDAIAGAVAEYSRQQRIATDDRALIELLALQNMLFIVTTAFQALRSGNVGTAGATGDLIERTLTAIQSCATLGCRDNGEARETAPFP